MAIFNTQSNSPKQLITLKSAFGVFLISTKFLVKILLIVICKYKMLFQRDRVHEQEKSPGFSKRSLCAGNHYNTDLTFEVSQFSTSHFYFILLLFYFYEKPTF